MPWTKDNLPAAVTGKKWTADQIEVFVAAANAALRETGQEAGAIETGIKLAEHENKNAKQFPRIYYCRAMQPGLCGYENETVLVDTDALKKMLPTAVGKPVYIEHQKVDLENLKETAAGYIVDSFYNELDGWAWQRVIITDDAAHLAIANGLSVSTAYIPSEWGAGGKKNNCPFAREVLNGIFTHLAIVTRPRYEGADIMTPDEFKIYQDSKKRELEELQNSKPAKKGSSMLKFWKNERKEVTTIDEATEVELEGGKTVTVAEMLNAVKKNSEDETKKKEAEEKKNADPMVMCNGEEMPLSELVNRYNGMMEKKNAEEAEKKKKEDEEKKNAEEAEKKKAEEEKKNSGDDPKHFEELRNAHEKKHAATPAIETSSNMVERGRQRYGNPNSK